MRVDKSLEMHIVEEIRLLTGRGQVNDFSSNIFQVSSIRVDTLWEQHKFGLSNQLQDCVDHLVHISEKLH
jgi:hypothetical protein